MREREKPKHGDLSDRNSARHVDLKDAEKITERVQEVTEVKEVFSGRPALERLDRAALRARKLDRFTFKDQPRTPIVLILDGVEGNYNKGAVFRLCDAFMLEHLHLCNTDLEYWHRRFTKAARGTMKWVPYTVGENTMTVIERYRAEAYQIIVAEQCEGSVPVWEAVFSDPLCIVLGGELTGVSGEVIGQADLCVELPTMGMANSLNVSMSAGMLVFAAYQQLINS